MRLVLTAGYLINRTPTPLLHGKTPLFVLYNSAPPLTHLRVFGSLCYVHNQGHGGDKFSSRSKRCVFVALWKEGLEGLWSWEWHHLLFTWCCFLRRGISVFLISFDRFYASIGRCTSDRVTPDIDDDWLLPHLSDTSVAVPTVTPHIPISSFPRT